VEQDRGVQEGARTLWCLLGKKAGDNTQVRALASELGWPREDKQVTARPWELLVHLGPGATLAGIDRSASSPLAPPWPDLVLTAGRRNEAVAQWIRQQSGGRTRLVHLGRPWADPADWDLVVTTPQYFLPRADNIVHNSLPLHRLDAAQLRAAGETFRPQLAGLPRPWIAVLVGGDSGRFVFTRAKGERLGQLADRLAGAAGGSLLVSDSPRTPQATGDALLEQLSAPRFVYRWGSREVNPYRGLLALADAFVVTGESMSMLGETASTGRPLYVFDPGDGDRPWWTLPHCYRYKPLSHRLAMALGPERMRRDVGNIQRSLVQQGAAEWLEPDMIAAAALRLKGLPDRAGPAVGEGAGRSRRELARAAAAVRRLFPAR
jgi:mitochondrial fission protein ELM1